MNREQRRQLNKKFTKRDERDMFGIPINRAKTWGSRQDCPKMQRRKWKTEKVDY